MSASIVSRMPAASAARSAGRASSLPVLKKGTYFSSTVTASPVRGLRPCRASRFLTEKAPKPRSSTRWPGRHRLDDLVEDRADDALDVPLEQVRVLLGDLLDELGLDHCAPRFPAAARRGDRSGPPSRAAILAGIRDRGNRAWGRPRAIFPRESRRLTPIPADEARPERPFALDLPVADREVRERRIARFEPGDRLGLAADLVDQPVLERQPPGEDRAVRHRVERRPLEPAPLADEAAEPAVALGDQRLVDAPAPPGWSAGTARARP